MYYPKIFALTRKRREPSFRFYTDQNAFEHEKENVFAKSWICVAHSSELANANDYVTREIIGESIVLVRGRDKVLRAFYNVCPHRGHQLLSSGKSKKCDYLPISRMGIQTRWQSGPCT